MYSRFWCCPVVCVTISYPSPFTAPSKLRGTVAFYLISSHLGAGILSGGKSSNTSIGENIILAGLFIQILTFGTFLAVAVLFHVRMHANPTPKSSHPGTPWEKHLYVLYFVSLLIMIRSVIRVVEYIQGNAGYILSHEIFLYIFDATLMFIAVAIFNFIHPSELLPGRKMDDEEMENIEHMSREPHEG